MPSSALRDRTRLALANGDARDELMNYLLLGFGTTGNVFYVDSGAGDDTVNDGKASNRAYATWDKALGACTANNGDIIVLMPGHVEDISNDQWDVDVAGVTTIGLGHGPDRPRFDFNHANASINVQASGCVIRNITLRPSVTVVAIGIDVEAAVTDTLLQDIEILPGEAGDGTDEFVLGVDIKAGCTRTRVKNFKYRQHASADGTNAGISLTGASDDCSFEDIDIYIVGTAAVAGIKGITTLSTNVRMKNVVVYTDAEPGVELLTGTTGVLEEVRVFSDLGTIDAAIVADGCAFFDCKYVEVGNEAGTLIKTESVDD